MSRELKRVPLDFDYSLNKVWEGYLNPYHKYSKKCPFCDGSGVNEEMKKIDDAWYSFNDQDWIYKKDGSRYNNKAWKYHLTQDEIDALVEERRLMDLTHKWDKGKWVPRIVNGKPFVPTPEIVNEWAKRGIGHDSINRIICVRVRAKRLGVYGECEFCNAKGYVWLNEKYEKLAEEWEREEPPKGEGYQLWENCSEGSPQSPVFKTLDELCEWSEKNATTFGSHTVKKEEWKKMLSEGFVYYKKGNAVFM